MAVNHYFQGGQGIGNDSEKTLYENLIIEGLKIYGFDVYYLPRTLVNQDITLPYFKFPYMYSPLSITNRIKVIDE